MSLEKCFVVLLTFRDEERKTVRKHLGIYNVGSGRGSLFQGSLDECKAFILKNKHLESLTKFD
jgi:hypothetical protein